jgi:tripartite-type tricarboxylate transporter receptor subunit TctC
MKNLQRRQLVLASMASLGLSSTRVRAQTYPTRAVTLVVASPAGGPIDASARVMAPVMQRALGQTVIVLNVPGAGGSLGVQRLADVPPDGYTMFLGTPSDTVLAPLALAIARTRPESLRLVGRVSHAEYVFVTRPGLQFKDTDELIARMRAKGNQELSYASFGHGAINHIAMEELLLKVGGAMLHVPVPGMAPTINNLVGNQIDVCLMPIAGPTVSMVRDRKLLPMFVASDRRHPQMPDVPTTAEIPALRGFRLSIWLGLFLPAAAPTEIANRLHAVVGEVVASPEFRKFSEDGGSIISTSASAAAAEQFYESEIARYRALAQSIKLEAK